MFSQRFARIFGVTGVLLLVLATSARAEEVLNTPGSRLERPPHTDSGAEILSIESGSLSQDKASLAIDRRQRETDVYQEMGRGGTTSSVRIRNRLMSDSLKSKKTPSLARRIIRSEIASGNSTGGKPGSTSYSSGAAEFFFAKPKRSAPPESTDSTVAENVRLLALSRTEPAEASPER